MDAEGPGALLFFFVAASVVPDARIVRYRVKRVWRRMNAREDAGTVRARLRVFYSPWRSASVIVFSRPHDSLIPTIRAYPKNVSVKLEKSAGYEICVV
jgi:hypothetical protein